MIFDDSFLDDFPWEIGSLRFTGFRSPLSSEVDPLQWWINAVGDDPENFNRKPQQSQTVIDGTYLGAHFVLAITPQRIDWRLEASIGGDAPQSYPFIPNRLEVLNQFHAVIQAWISREQLSFRRVAFGSEFIQPVKTDAEGYDILINRYLSFIPNTTDASDIFFQINKFTTIDSPIDIKINRIRKWTLARLKYAGLIAGVEGAETSEVHAARLEIDVNTDQHYHDELSTAVTSDIFAHLVREGIKLAMMEGI